MFREEDKFLSLAIRRDSMPSPLTYFAEIFFADSDKLINRWRPSLPGWKVSFKVGSIADINFSITPNKNNHLAKETKKIFTS